MGGQRQEAQGPGTTLEPGLVPERTKKTTELQRTRTFCSMGGLFIILTESPQRERNSWSFQHPWREPGTCLLSHQHQREGGAGRWMLRGPKQTDVYHYLFIDIVNLLMSAFPKQQWWRLELPLLRMSGPQANMAREIQPWHFQERGPESTIEVRGMEASGERQQKEGNFPSLSCSLSVSLGRAHTL